MSSLFALILPLGLIVTPALIIVITIKLPLLDKIGVVTLTFLSGIGLSLFTSQLDTMDTISADNFALWQSAQSNVLDISIALALPMLIFSFDIRHAFRSARKILFAMLLAIISVMLVATGLAMLFGHWLEWLDEIWQYAGLGVGAYIGGGVNMAVIKTAIGADESVFITMTSYDLLLSSLYLFFMLTIVMPVVRRVLPVYQNSTYQKSSSKNQNNADNENNYSNNTSENAGEFKKLLPLSIQKYNMFSLIVAIAIIGLSVVLASFFPSNLSATLTIIFISSFAVVASLLPKVHNLPTSYRLGMYLVMVFCFTAGSMMDVAMFTQTNWRLFGFLSLLIFGSSILHLGLCKLFKIDADSFMVTSFASIMSLPFIPLVCNRMNNRELLIPGISVAIIGYVVGTYLGIFLGYMLR